LFGSRAERDVPERYRRPILGLNAVAYGLLVGVFVVGLLTIGWLRADDHRHLCRNWSAERRIILVVTEPVIMPANSPPDVVLRINLRNKQYADQRDRLLTELGDNPC
jgi:hypothetical protein